MRHDHCGKEVMDMAEAKTDTKSSTAKASTAKAAERTGPKEATPGEAAALNVNPNANVTGADNPLTSTDGEKRPEEFTAGEELYDSATWKQTHGANPAEEAKLRDF
jgi:hypothetical protein